MDITIEKGIPIPSRTAGRQTTSPLRTILSSMECGDSFLLPKKKTNNLTWAAQKEKVKITFRTINAETIRVWRVA